MVKEIINNNILKNNIILNYYLLVNKEFLNKLTLIKIDNDIEIYRRHYKIFYEDIT